MTPKKQVKNLTKAISRFILLLLLVTAFFLFEPTLRSKFTFAITSLDHSRISDEQIGSNYIPETTESQAKPQRSHAPEPSTLLLFLSGVAGIIVRFAQKSFDKFKRISDLVLSIAGLVVASPILILAAIMIKLTSKGPVIYKQTRVGKDGEIFEIYKLRTMCANAEKGTGAIWAKADDPRVTPIGKVLRRIHIDELPQIFNVLKGEMSIVGPRPERPEMVRDLKKLIIDYEKRLKVQPGITGLAQIYHRYDETIADVRKKIKYDLLYIKRMCWLVEIRILAQTFVVALTGKGAR